MANLTELRDVLRQNGRATLQSLAIHAGSDESAVEAMLKRWESKGRVRRVEAADSDCGCGCGKSCSCGCSTSEVIYEWVG